MDWYESNIEMEREAKIRMREDMIFLRPTIDVGKKETILFSNTIMKHMPLM